MSSSFVSLRRLVKIKYIVKMNEILNCFYRYSKGSYSIGCIQSRKFKFATLSMARRWLVTSFPFTPRLLRLIVQVKPFDDVHVNLVISLVFTGWNWVRHEGLGVFSEATLYYIFIHILKRINMRVCVRDLSINGY